MKKPTLNESPLQKAISLNNPEEKSQEGQKALLRQGAILKDSSLNLGEHQKTFAEAYSYNSGPFINDFIRYGRNNSYPDGYFPREANIPRDSLSRVEQFIDIVDMLPSTGDVTLYKGSTGSGSRDTFGEAFRLAQ